MYLNSPRMLITDDDLDFRETLRGVFERRGFETLLAENGEEALEIFNRENVHVILSDMHMPKLTGLETIRRVKLIRSAIPCILISAGLTDTLVREAEQADVFTVLSKPIRCGEITATVIEAMEEAYHWPTA